MFKSVPDVGRAGLQCEAWWELSLYSRKANQIPLWTTGIGGTGNSLSMACWEGVTVEDSESGAGALHRPQDEAREVLRCRVSGSHPMLHNPERESLPYLILGSGLMSRVYFHPHPTFCSKVLASPSSSHFPDGHVEDERHSTHTSSSPTGSKGGGSELAQAYLQRVVIKHFVTYPLWRKCVTIPIHWYLFIYLQIVCMDDYIIRLI